MALSLGGLFPSALRTTQSDAISLSRFKDPNTPNNLPPACQAVYQATIPGCSDSDFRYVNNVNTCSSSCISGLEMLTPLMQQNCGKVAATSNSLVALFNAGKGVPAVCLNVREQGDTNGSGTTTQTQTQVPKTTAQPTAVAPTSKAPAPQVTQQTSVTELPSSTLTLSFGPEPTTSQVIISQISQTSAQIQSSIQQSVPVSTITSATVISTLLTQTKTATPTAKSTTAGLIIDGGSEPTKSNVAALAAQTVGGDSTGGGSPFDGNNFGESNAGVASIVSLRALIPAVLVLSAFLLV